MSGHEILLHIAGGAALLLWSARMVRTGLLRAFGVELRRYVGRATRRWTTAALAGFAIAAALQSSTATVLLAVSFAGRGFMALAPALALTLGADLGSTMVVQFLSFDFSWLSPILLVDTSINAFICRALNDLVRRSGLSRSAVCVDVGLLRWLGSLFPTLRR